MDSQNLSNLVWSFASFAWLHPPLLAAISAEALRKIEDFSAMELTMTAWSY